MNESIEKSLNELITPIVNEYGFELVDIEYKNEAGGMVLRIYLDREGGITIDDCSIISKELSTQLDVSNIIHNSYTLEVSSPGLRRPLKKENDFNRFKEKKVKIKTKELIKDRRNFLGTLKGIEDRLVMVEVEGVLYNLPLDSIAKANLELEF
ncbi:MAG: ribosome maturation factor RimP [Candidatus Dadabacteria bacterium]|nr:ribosome maturation factor RimP [Candidatus Dadabacteria bacterium]NIQ16375.1 ribosome maturation factor RimP [Candidatus Dadabacteria bacterium]